MTLAEAVRLALDDPLTFSQPLPQVPKMARTAASIAERMDGIGTLEQVDLAALRRRLEHDGDLGALGPRDFKHVAHLLWDLSPLAAEPRFVARYLDEMRRRSSGPAFRRLALLWLLRFAADAPAIREVAALLRAVAPRLRGALAVPAIAQRIFDPVRGPAALAKEIAEGTGSPAEILERRGLKGPVLEGGFVLAAFRALLATLEQAMSATRASYLPLLECVLTFARGDQDVPRFDQARSDLAEALLRPFGAEDPPLETRERIESEILGRLGDPRLAVDRWAGVSQEAKEVMLRWLAEATLEAFLAIVQKHADREHWRYREAFWRAYLRAGYIRSVQVAFRPQAAEEARRLARKDRRLLAFAELSGNGTLTNHAVLLLRIGNLTLAEWSHSGALRVWRAGDPKAPRLTARQFDGPELRTPADLRVVHAQPQGGWQAKVAEFIWRETGLRVQATQYMPRR